MDVETHIKVAPDAARVWRGFMSGHYRRREDGVTKFRQALREVFIPLTVQAMAPLGLTAYQPTILSDDDPLIPDEIALVFYESQHTYKDAMKTTLGKAYGMLHGNVFNFSRSDKAVPWSTSAFPTMLGAELLPDKPCHLFGGEIDWYHGHTEVYVGTWDKSVEEKALKGAWNVFSTLQVDRPMGLDGLIVVASPRYLIAWSHGEEPSVCESRLREEIGDDLRTVLCKRARSLTVPDSMLDRLQALDIDVNDPVNTRFVRRCLPT